MSKDINIWSIYSYVLFEDGADCNYGIQDYPSNSYESVL